MKLKDSERTLRERLEEAPDRTVGSLIEVMFAFYADLRADGPMLNADGDMLLYQWGTYDWGAGEHFELDITRQFILPGEDEPFQLHVTMRFEATDERRELGDGHRWCSAPEQLSLFKRFVRGSPAFQMLHREPATNMEIVYEQC